MSIQKAIATVLGELRNVANSGATVGTPVQAGQATVIPVSRLALGFGVGMADASAQQDSSMETGAQGAGAGLSIDPQAFIVVGPDGVARLMTVHNPAKAAITHAFDALPQIVDKAAGVGKVIMNRKATPQLQSDAASTVVDTATAAEPAAVESDG